MKKLLASFVIVSLLLGGCTGSFNLTKKVYHIHRSQADKWVDELIFLAFIIVPVYGISMLGDGILFNSIEFWTGNNPVAANTPPALPIAQNRVGSAELRAAAAPGLPTLRIVGQDWQENFVFTPENGALVARTSDGALRFRAVTNSDASISVFDGQGQLLRTFAAEQVAAVDSRGPG